MVRPEKTGIYPHLFYATFTRGNTLRISFAVPFINGRIVQQFGSLLGVSKGNAVAKAVTVLALETRLAIGTRTTTETWNIMPLLYFQYLLF